MISASLSMLPAAIINGLMYGAIYALVALGLTLIYGVLHIINFAHGAMPVSYTHLTLPTKA